MKPYALLIALFACSGCHSSSAMKHPSIESRINDCNAIYERVLKLTFDQKVDLMHEYSGDKRAYGIHLLDEQFKTSGVSSRFFLFCMNKMTEEQIVCAKTVTTVEGINTCTHLVK
jgi:hypothetical protein